jgi:hypothetical protein
MTTPQDEQDELLIEAAAAAWRPLDPHGGITVLPAWHDLDDAGRREAFEVARTMRALEAAVDQAGLSTTGRAVLARVRRARRGSTPA